MVAYHPPNIQLFNRDLVVLVDQRTGGFVSKVLPRPLDLQMRLCQQCTRLVTAITALHAARETALCLFQLAFGSSIVAWVGNLRSVRQRCKGLQSDIYTHSLADGWQRRGHNLTGDACIPAVSFANKRTGFGCAAGRAILVETKCANLGEDEPPIHQLDAVAPLRIGEAIVPSPTLEPGIARRLTSLNAPKERLKRPIDTMQHVLKYLGMDAQQIGRLTLESGQAGTLTGKADRLATPLIRGLALAEHVIVEVAACFQCLRKTRRLCRRRTQLVDEGFQSRVLCTSI
jgi:hypothetical protein